MLSTIRMRFSTECAPAKAPKDKTMLWGDDKSVWLKGLKEKMREAGFDARVVVSETSQSIKVTGYHDHARTVGDDAIRSLSGLPFVKPSESIQSGAGERKGRKKDDIVQIGPALMGFERG